jgi:multiple sugar transport system ATP-binding protein
LRWGGDMEVLLRDVTKVFGSGITAVDGVSLQVNTGEFIVLLGPSGCGKTTLLRMIAGLDEATAGDVLLNGRSAGDFSHVERGVAMVFQELALYPHMSVGDNIGFPLRFAGVDEASRREQVIEVASALGIADLLGRRPSQLSGGQRQRVAMGRALIRRPKLFLMDEPLSNLDSKLRSELRAEISKLVRDLGVTCIYVTHDQTEALTMADRVAILRAGVLQDFGTPAQVYGRPATLSVAAFLGSPRMCLLEATVNVLLDRYVVLRLGTQELHLPWDDPRARSVAHYHGERIVVGVRSEALTPVPPDTSGNVLRGHIRHLEHHGHESLAYVDVGATAVEVDGPADTAPRPARASRGIRRLIDRLARGKAPVADPQPTMEVGRHHRKPAELAVRLAPYPAVGPGQSLTVAVRADAIHFFDGAGPRIDVGRR